MIEKPTFKSSDIRKMSDDEFMRYEKDIAMAQREGRFVQDE